MKKQRNTLPRLAPLSEAEKTILLTALEEADRDLFEAATAYQTARAMKTLSEMRRDAAVEALHVLGLDDEGIRKAREQYIDDRAAQATS